MITQKISSFFLISVLVLSACTSSVQSPSVDAIEKKPDAAGTTADIAVADSKDMIKYELDINQQVTIRGTAENARLGAIVMTSDYTPIYMDAIMKWDSGLVGKPIEVTGTLRLRLPRPKSEASSDGEVSPGIVEDSYVLENPTWQVSD